MFSDSMMLGGGRKAAFSIDQSVRLDGVADYLTHTNSSNGNSKTWTFSIWFKLSAIKDQILFSAIGDATNSGYLHLTQGGNLQLRASNEGDRTSSVVLRDTTSWYHLVWSYDSTNSQQKAWLNGVDITETFSPALAPTQNKDSAFNVATYLRLGRHYDPYDYYFGGYIGETVMVDGQALDSTVFGVTDPATGSWRPKKANITDYGTNGFHLDFADSANLGQDVSGLGNTWSPVSLDSTDVVADSPTNNYCTWNPLDNGSPVNTYAQGNLKCTVASGNNHMRSTPTMHVSAGKYYAEVVFGAVTDNSSYVGLIKESAGHGISANDALWYVTDGAVCLSTSSARTSIVVNGATVEVGATMPGFAAGAVLQVALDMDNKRVWYGINGAWVLSGDPANGLNPLYSDGVLASGRWGIAAGGHGNTGDNWTANFGQRAFTYTPPTGFKALCTANLPAPAIQAPAKHMGVVSWTGDGTSPTLRSVGFQPDFVWVKKRVVASAHNEHQLFDALRNDGTDPLFLQSNSASVESSSGRFLSTLANQAFTSDGFNVSSDGNVSGNSYVAWCWKAGNASTANTDGSIAATVSANPTAGFSIVTYSGTGTAGTVGHGLGAAPALILHKDRTSAVSWRVYHASTGAAKEMILNTNGAASATSTSWNGTTPDNGVFSVGSGTGVTNQSGHNYVAYCWAEIKGFSKFGLYTGNGSVNGPFIDCGFRPRWILIKRTTYVETGGSWFLFDTVRSPYNVVGNNLQAENTAGDATTATNSDTLDIVATGFKIRETDLSWNESGATYAFAAFAEYPLGGAKTTPAKAR